VTDSIVLSISCDTNAVALARDIDPLIGDKCPWHRGHLSIALSCLPRHGVGDAVRAGRYTWQTNRPRPQIQLLHLQIFTVPGWQCPVLKCSYSTPHPRFGRIQRTTPSNLVLMAAGWGPKRYFVVTISELRGLNSSATVHELPAVVTAA
jgi:hypothetical protein